MKIGTLIIFFCITNIFIGSSQSSFERMFESESIDYPEYRYKNIKGSPYYFKGWVNAEIYEQSGEIFEDLQVNYNIFKEVMEVKIGKNISPLILIPTGA